MGCRTIIDKLVIKEKKPYDSWEEREKAETKQTIKQKLLSNNWSYVELTKRKEKLLKEYEEVKERMEEIEGEIIYTEYLRTMLALIEMMDDDDE